MAIINKGEITKRIIDGLRLDPGREKIPTELAEKVLPVYTVNEIGEILSIGDTFTNSNDQTFTVPIGKSWFIRSIFCSWIATATVGNRVVTLNITDDRGNNTWNSRSNNIIADATEIVVASTNTGNFHENPATNHHLELPSYKLPEGWALRIFDVNDVDANDDPTIFIVVEEFSQGG